MLKGKRKGVKRCLKKVFRENLNVLKVNFSCSDCPKENMWFPW